MRIPGWVHKAFLIKAGMNRSGSTSGQSFSFALKDHKQQKRALFRARVGIIEPLLAINALHMTISRHAIVCIQFRTVLAFCRIYD